MIDPFALAFYAAICGLLSVLAPNLGGYVPRFTIGALVGMAAAGSLPTLRVLLFGG